MQINFVNSYLSKHIDLIGRLVNWVISKVDIHMGLLEIDNDLPRIIEVCSHIPVLVFNNWAFSNYGDIKWKEIQGMQFWIFIVIIDVTL